METTDVIIVGGGILGCACGYYLARHGQRCIVLEKGRVALEGASADLQRDEARLHALLGV